MRARVLIATLAVLVGGGAAVAAPAAAIAVQTPTIAVSFGASTVTHSGDTTLSFTIYNPNSAQVSQPTFGFTDSLPLDQGQATMVFPGGANTTDTCNGTLQDTSTSISYSGGSVGSQSICVVSIDLVASDDAGVWDDSVELDASNGGSTNASADLTIVGGTYSTVYYSTTFPMTPRSVRVGDTVPLTVDLYNPNTTVQLTGVSFTNSIPSGFEIAAQPDESQTCGGGTVTADAGGQTFSMTGGTLDVSPDSTSECRWTIHVTAVQDGFWTDPIGSASSVEGGVGEVTPSSTASLSVLGSGPRVIWDNALPSDESGSFSFAELDNSGAGDLLDAGKAKANAEGFSLDPAHDDDVYYISGANPNDTATQHLFASRLDSASSDEIAASTDVMWGGLAFDRSDQRIYWEGGGGTYSYSGVGSLDGGNVSVPGREAGTGGLEIDNSSHLIYWSSGTEIDVANLDGSNAQVLATAANAHLDDPRSLAVDTVGNRIYWANTTDGTIGWASLNGNQHGELDTTGATIDEPQGIAVDPVADRVYWTNGGGNSIAWTATDGSSGGTLDTDGAVTYQPYSLALLYPPSAAARPTVTGAGAVGSTLHCNAARWSPDRTEAQFYRAPASVTTQWLKNGSPIAGATGTTYQASATGGYSCRQTASNDAGIATSTSTVHPIYLPPSTGKVTVRVSRRSATARFSGAGHRTGFQCLLSAGKPVGTWTRCRSPHTYRGLKPGRYTLLVRASGPGGVDPTPATRTFRIR